MGPLRLVLFDDRAARQWMPFVLTRPAGELRFGAFTLRERAERVFGARCLGHLAAPHLAGFDEPDGAPVLDPAALPPDADLLFLSSRAVPAWGARLERPGTAAVVAVGGDQLDGGAERADSVAAGLSRVKPTADFVCVHDAVRPCLVDEWITKVFQAAERTGAAIFAVPVTATLKRVGAQHIIQQTVAREELWEAQTPQVFRRELLMQAYAQRGTLAATDDAQLVERLGHPVTVVPGSVLNLKITSKEDLRLAEQVLKVLPKPKLGPIHPFADDDMWR